MMKKFILPFLIMMLTFSGVNASIASYEVKMDGSSITVTGSLDENKDTSTIALTVLEDAYSFDAALPGGAALNDAVVFLEQLDLIDGVVNFEFKFPVDGTSRPMKARLYDGTSKKDFAISYVTTTDFNTAVAGIAGNTGTLTAFNTYLDTADNEFDLCASEIPAGATKVTAREILYNTIKANPTAKLQNPTAAKILWDECILVSLFNEGKVSDISAYAEYVDLTDSKVAKWFNHVLSQPGASGKVTEVILANSTVTGTAMGGTPYQTTDEFDAKLKEGLILATVKFHNGIGNVGAVLNDFSAITGITAKNETEKYKVLGGQDYPDIPTLISAYNTVKTPAIGGGSFGGGGGAGGGSGDGYVSVVGGTLPPGNNDSQTIAMKFIDLDTVPWAYEAISTLFDEGIIAGREETLFMPDDLITREEFVKLCVMIMGLENQSFTNKFNDVNQADWFCRFVNIATSNGLCQGTGNGEFGVGLNIKREDMAVILNNVLNKKGIAGNSQNAGFADEDKIDGYAKNAVNVLVNHKIINGVGDNMFDPQAPATRAEAAKMLFGAWELIR